MSFINILTGCSNSSIEEAKTFGTKEFNSAEWKKANNTNRSRMIYSFLKNHDITSMSPANIYEMLGESTAYYEYDEFPAYLLETNQGKYIIAFPVDRETKTIRKYILEPE